jgi:phage shock protein C
MTATKTCCACFKDIDSRAARCEHCTQLQPDRTGLHRQVPGKLVAGVCASFAQHFNWDVTVMRIAFVASLAITGGLVLWVYFAAWLMTPLDVGGRAPLLKFGDWLSGVFSAPKNGVERL